MRPLDQIPKGSRVLLTAPVIIYGIFARKATHHVPLSEQCTRLLDSCRTSYYAGIVTTATISKCWELLDRLRFEVSNLEEDADAGFLALKIKRPVQNALPKRINGLLFGELEVVPVDPQAFERAAEFVKETRLPISMALDVAAASKPDAPQPAIALASEPKWPVPATWNPYRADDLPWQKKYSPPEPWPSKFYISGTLAAPVRKPKKPKPKFDAAAYLIRRKRRQRRKAGELSFDFGAEEPKKPAD